METQNKGKQTTLYDFGTTVAKIREASNQIEVKGRENVTYILYIHQLCDELIGKINAACERAEAKSDGGEMNE